MHETNRKIYEFDHFRLDVFERQLWKDKRAVPIPPTAFDLLVVLVENNGSLIERESLYARVWPDSIVEDANLTVQISAIRKALEEPSCISTVSGHGYRFSWLVTELNGRNGGADLEIKAILPENGTSTDAGTEHEPIRSHILIEEEIDSSEDRAGMGEIRLTKTFTDRIDETPVSWYRKHAAVVLLPVLAVFASGGFLGWYVLFRNDKIVPKQAKTFALVTNSGKAGNATISPDGKFVAYAQNHTRGDGSLYILQVDTNREVRLLDPGERVFNGTAFSADGSFIYYGVIDKQDPRGALYRVPVLGGVATRMLPNVGSMFSFSPEGDHVAFYRKDHELKTESLIIANLDGTREVSILTRPNSEMIFSAIPAWAPDGRSIVFGADMNRRPDKPWLDVKLYSIQIETREIKQLSNDVWGEIGKTTWLADGSGLIFVALAPGIGRHIFFFDHKTGETHRITEGLQGFGNFSLGVTADGSTMVAGTWDEASNLWVIGTDGNTSRAIQLSIGGKDGHLGLTDLADGRVAYLRGLGNKYDIWTINPDGTDLKPLTQDPFSLSGLTSTADGRYLVFVSNRAGGNHLFRMNVDGTDIQQLTFGENTEHAPDASPDSQWIVYQSWFANTFRLRKIPIDGGEFVDLTDYDAVQPAFSPDGKWISCILPSDSPAHNATLAVIPANGGPPHKTFPVVPFGHYYLSPRWMRDGSSLVYQKEEQRIGNLWIQPMAGGEPTRFTNFNTDLIFNYVLARDNRNIYVSRGQRQTNILMIKNFRP